MKQLHSHIKPFALILFIASFSLPTHHANAQATGVDETINQEAIAIDQKVDTEIKERYGELFISSGYAFHDDPEIWNNNTFFSFGFRSVNGNLQSKRKGFIEYEVAGTNQPEGEDGLIRHSFYQKLGFGYIFNKSRAETTFFSEFGGGLLKSVHFVEGEAAWRAPASDEEYDYHVEYENSGPFLGSHPTGIYLHLAFGFKIENRHKFSFYIHPMYEGPLSATGEINAPSDNDDNPYQEEEPYYYGEIPDKITNAMVGFRYSYILQPTDSE